MCNFITHGPCPQNFTNQTPRQGHILHYDGAQTWCRHEHVDPWAKIKHTLKTKGEGEGAYDICANYYILSLQFTTHVPLNSNSGCHLQTWCHLELDTSWKDGRCGRKRKGNPSQILEMAGQHLMWLEFMSRFRERTPASTIETIFIKQA